MESNIKSDSEVIYRYQNRLTLAMPWAIKLLMIIVFGIPMMLPLLTWRMIPETPWVLAIWPIAVFPWLVLYLLARLMSRYGLIVFSNGDTQIIYPFSSIFLDRQNLDSIVAEQRFVPSTRSNVTWLRFADKNGNILASLSPIAFPSNVMADYFAAIKKTHPELRIKV